MVISSKVGDPHHSMRAARCKSRPGGSGLWRASRPRATLRTGQACAAFCAPQLALFEPAVEGDGDQQAKRDRGEDDEHRNESGWHGGISLHGRAGEAIGAGFAAGCPCGRQCHVLRMNSDRPGDAAWQGAAMNQARIRKLLLGFLDWLLEVNPQCAKYLPTVRTGGLMPCCRSMSRSTSARFPGQKSIFNCSGRLSIMVRRVCSFCSGFSTRPAPGSRPRGDGRMADSSIFIGPNQSAFR